MSIEKAKELCCKYIKANKFFEPFIANDFVEMPFIAKKLVNQVTQEILDELEDGE